MFVFFPWQVGDAVFYADGEYGRAVLSRAEMADIFGLDEGTLGVYANVAGRFKHRGAGQGSASLTML